MSCFMAPMRVRNSEVRDLDEPPTFAKGPRLCPQDQPQRGRGRSECWGVEACGHAAARAIAAVLFMVFQCASKKLEVRLSMKRGGKRKAESGNASTCLAATHSHSL